VQLASSVPAGKVSNGGYVCSHAIRYVSYRRSLAVIKNKHITMKYKLLIITFSLFSGVIMGQKNLDDYDMTCYCSARETPHGVVSFDNNLQLISSFKKGLSKKELDSLHIPYTDSQLKLLRIFNLIRKEKDKYFSNIPFLDEKQTYLLRAQSKQIADKILPHIEPDIKELVSYLTSIGNSNNVFSIAFSYVLDGLPWQIFEEKKIIKPLDSKDNISPWTGFFWILTSNPSSKSGTNTESDSTFTIGITGGPYRLMKSIYDEEDGLLKVMLRNYIVSGKVTDEKVFKTFEPYNLFNQKGELTIPIIVENDQNKLYVLSKQIAEKICMEMTSMEVANRAIKDFNFQNEEQAVIILYHEVMWNLLSIMEEKKLIEKPIIIKNPDKAEMKDAADLMYIIRKN